MSTIGRMPPQTPRLPALRPAAPEDVRQAQRAFFAAAAGQPAAEPATPLGRAEPDRMLRPGSLVDIKI